MASYSIVKKSQLEGAHRLDAEYYQPEYFIDFTKGTWKSIGECLNMCQYGLSLAMNDDKIGRPMFKMDNIKNGFLLEDDVRYAKAPQSLYDEYKIKKNDIFFNRVNSEEFVGRTGINKLSVDGVFASYLIRIRPETDSDILPDYLNIFLNSSFGKKQIKKFSRRAVNQANVNAEELKQIRIALLPPSFQKEIERLSNESWGLIEESKSLYHEAENLLLEELGLQNFEADGGLWSVVNYSDVKAAGRMDAEYFQSKFQSVIKKVEKYSGGWEFLEDLTTFINNGIQPPYSENGGIKFFSQKWIGDKSIDYSFLTADNEPKVLKSFFEEKRNKPYLVEKNDILYYSVGANLGYCHNYLESDNIAIGSFINLIRADATKIDPIFLGFCLNSMVGRMQAERDKSGLAQPYIYAKNLRKFKIPVVKKNTQQKIAELIHGSHTARKRSKELLDEAKRRVEELIERRT